MSTRLIFQCPRCFGDGEYSRQADPMDYIEGAAVAYGMVTSRCYSCGGSGEVEGSPEDIEEWGEPIREERQ